MRTFMRCAMVAVAGFGLRGGMWRRRLPQGRILGTVTDCFRRGGDQRQGDDHQHRDECEPRRCRPTAPENIPRPRSNRAPTP